MSDDLVNDCDDIRERLNDKIDRLEAEVSRLTNLAQEGRKTGLEEAAKEVKCRMTHAMLENRRIAETSQGQDRFRLLSKAYEDEDMMAILELAIRALIPQEQGK